MKKRKKTLRSPFPAALPLNENPYEHLFPKILLQYRKLFFRGRKIKQAILNREEVLFHPASGKYYFHPGLIKEFTLRGKELKRYFLGEKRRKRQSPSNGITIEHLKNDAKAYEDYANGKSAYKKASNIVFTLESNGLSGKTVKKEHEKIRERIKRFVLGYSHLIAHNFVPPRSYYTTHRFEIYEEAFFHHILGLLNSDRLSDDKNLTKKIRRNRAISAFDVYVNALFKKMAPFLDQPSFDEQESMAEARFPQLRYAPKST